jgi:hypothetical protein
MIAGRHNQFRLLRRQGAIDFTFQQPDGVSTDTVGNAGPGVAIDLDGPFPAAFEALHDAKMFAAVFHSIDSGQANSSAQAGVNFT